MRAITIHCEDEDFEKRIIDEIENLISKLDKKAELEVNYFITE